MSSEARISRARARIAAQSIPPQALRGAWPRKMFSATVRSGNSSSSWKSWRCRPPAPPAGRRSAPPGRRPRIVPGIGPVDARDDLDQRRLAGAVLAQQRVDLAGMDVEADAVQRPHAGKRLAQAVDREHRCAAAASATSRSQIHRASRCRASRSRAEPSMRGLLAAWSPNRDGLGVGRFRLTTRRGRSLCHRQHHGRAGHMARAAPLENRWDDAQAAGLDEPGRLLYRSNLLGADQRITNYRRRQHLGQAHGDRSADRRAGRRCSGSKARAATWAR